MANREGDDRSRVGQVAVGGNDLRVERIRTTLALVISVSHGDRKEHVKVCPLPHSSR